MARVFVIQTIVSKGCVAISGRTNESRSDVNNESGGTRAPMINRCIS